MTSQAEKNREIQELEEAATIQFIPTELGNRS